MQILEAILDEKVVEKSFQICNVDRAVCGRIAGAIAKKYGDTVFAGQLNITYVVSVRFGLWLLKCTYAFADSEGVPGNPLDAF